MDNFLLDDEGKLGHGFMWPMNWNKSISGMVIGPGRHISVLNWILSLSKSYFVERIQGLLCLGIL